MRHADTALRSGFVRNTSFFLLVFLLALLPRVLGLRDFVTVDEAMHWQTRVAAFSAALAEGRFADTILAGHPGVTTLWLGSLGLAIERALQATGWLAVPDYATHLALLRLPVGFATALGPAMGYLLLRRLFDARIALLAALFWASNPFLIAHSRLLHLDALLATLLTLGLLALLAAFFNSNGALPRPSRPLLLLAGIAWGLALLTKVPSIVLLPVAGCVALAWIGQATGGLERRITQATGALLLWVAVALSVAFALWPALWVTPAAAIARLVRETLDNGDSPHGWGNFFMGQAVADPGPLFYPAVLALRSTPWTLLGLLALLGVTGAQATSRLRRQPGADRLPLAASARYRTTLALLVLFALLFLLALTLPAKKFDRYLLPIFPALDMLAAAGLFLALDRLDLRARRVWAGLYHNGSEPRSTLSPPTASGNPWSRAARRLSPAACLLSLLVLAQLVTLPWYHPYYLAYYNPLLGGGAVAAQVLPIGWGEGMNQAAAWLNTQPDLADGAVASWFEFTLAPFVDGEVFSVGYLRRGREFFNYLVIYVDQVQRRNEPTIIDAYQGKRTPLHIVRIHGIDYAWIYQVPPHFDRPQTARFDERFRLVGSSLDASNIRAGSALSLTLGLSADALQTESPQLFIHLIGPDGQRYGQIDALAGDERFPGGGWGPGRTIIRRLPVVLAADAPPGEYRVLLGLYRLADGTRLPISAAASADPVLDGENALLIDSFTLQ